MLNLVLTYGIPSDFRGIVIFNTEYYRQLETDEYDTWSLFDPSTVGWKKFSRWNKLYLQPLIPPKRFDIFSRLTGGCSEGLGAF